MLIFVALCFLNDLLYHSASHTELNILLDALKLYLS